MAHFIQYSPNKNRGERIAEDFLKQMPEKCIVFAEYKMGVFDNDRTKKPDFIVLSPDFGILILEVKDWNIHNNDYSWVNQYKILTRNKTDGKEQTITNPFAQADEYRYHLIELANKNRCKNIQVSSFVVFPTVNRIDFENRFSDPKFFSNSQTRFLFDLEKTVFRDDLESNCKALDKFFLDMCKKQQHFEQTDYENYQKIQEVLLPSTFCVHSLSFKGKEHKKNVQKISQGQQKWAFGIQDDNALILDIAGSGKTTALISRAIYLSQHFPEKKMLLTTYNEKLTENLQEHYRNRVEEAKYPPFFTIQSCISLAEDTITGYDRGLMPNSEEDKIALAIDIIKENPEKYRVFDYIFVDEVQDFSDMHLYFLSLCCISDKGFFLTGDIAQKIYNRSFNLRNLNIDASRISLAKEYKMYRTPVFIAALALKFVSNSRTLKEEFTRYGYLDHYSLNGIQSGIRAEFKTEPLLQVVQSCLADGHPEKDIIVVSLPSLVENIKKEFQESGLLGQIEVLDYLSVKGFEAPCIILHGLEDLAPRVNAFSSPSEADDEDARFRRLAYIAMTRSMGELHIMVNEPNHRYIQELKNINQTLS